MKEGHRRLPALRLSWISETQGSWKSFQGFLKVYVSVKVWALWLFFSKLATKLWFKDTRKTRRPHPLAPDQTVVEGITNERRALAGIKELADRVFDTSGLTVHELRRSFMDLSRVGADKKLSVTVVSFGYKHGIPYESDLLFDVRFLPNPYFVRTLRSLTGRDRAVQEYLEKIPCNRNISG